MIGWYLLGAANSFHMKINVYHRKPQFITSMLPFIDSIYKCVIMYSSTWMLKYRQNSKSDIINVLSYFYNHRRSVWFGVFYGQRATKKKQKRIKKAQRKRKPINKLDKNHTHCEYKIENNFYVYPDTQLKSVYDNEFTCSFIALLSPHNYEKYQSTICVHSSIGVFLIFDYTKELKTKTKNTVFIDDFLLRARSLRVTFFLVIFKFNNHDSTQVANKVNKFDGAVVVCKRMKNREK